MEKDLCSLPGVFSHRAGGGGEGVRSITAKTLAGSSFSMDCTFMLFFHCHQITGSYDHHCHHLCPCYHYYFVI